MREIWAQKEFGTSYEQLGVGQQGQLDARLKFEMRRIPMTSKPAYCAVAERAAAVKQVAAHYIGLFGDDVNTGKAARPICDEFRISDRSGRSACVVVVLLLVGLGGSHRPPGRDRYLSYTSNWPHDPLVGNTPTAGTGIWSIASVILMIAAIAGMIFYHSTRKEEGDPTPPKADPLFNLKPTPSMQATKKYFYVVIGLILAQVGMGVITAHYAVEGTSFFGYPVG